tara:strand:- start:441 stop:1094 length:654 start_codon:yes stop_codon:yes gene_type:complete
MTLKMKNIQKRLKDKIKQNIQKKTPFLYNSIIKLKKEINLLKKESTDLIDFVISRYSKRPYFSIYTKGLKSDRRKCMAKFIQDEVKRNKGKYFKVLEIGSYLGSSAILWAEAIQKYNNGNGIVICLDSWVPFFGKNEEIGFSSNFALQMEKALKKDKVFPSFLYNIKVTDLDHIICPFKGKSEELLSNFKSESFNYIYIDAGHRYSEILNDLILSAP